MRRSGEANFEGEQAVVRDKRRTHYKASAQTIKICPETGESHLYHRAYEHEGKLYYRGKLVSSSI